MELDVRLQILRDSGQINEKNFEAMLKVISMLDGKWGIKLIEENGSMFITHLSIAFKRIEQNETVEAIDENLYQEVINNQYFGKSVEVLDDFEKGIGLEIPENEKGYIVMYLCMLFENE